MTVSQGDLRHKDNDQVEEQPSSYTNLRYNKSMIVRSKQQIEPLDPRTLGIKYSKSIPKPTIYYL